VLPAVNGIDTVVALVTEAVPIVGAPGTAKTNELDAVDAAVVPLPLVAVTVYVLVPAAVSVTTIGLDAPVLEAVEEEVAVNVCDFPPVAPAVNATDAVPFPAVAVPIVGTCGIDVTVTDDEADDAGPVPAALVPVTVNV
jgi:hypothetical protein